MDNLNLALLEKSQLEKAAKVLSMAMLKNPLHIAIFQGQGEAERQKIEEMFLGLFNENPAITFLAHHNEEIIAVMRMRSCDGSQAPDENTATADPNSPEYRISVWRRAWAHHDPKEQHWHLGPVGVLPSYQGKGIGKKLLGRFCKEVDACSASAYLETDTDENVRFYQRFGFRVVAESDILGVASRYMLRDPIS